MKYLKLICALTFFIPFLAIGQTISPLKKIECNNTQRVYLVFSSKVSFIDLSSVEVKYDVLGDKTIYFILSTPYFDPKTIVNGLIICEDNSHYPIEIRKGGDYLSETTLQMFGQTGKPAATNPSPVGVTSTFALNDYVSTCKYVMGLKRDIFNLGKQKKGIVSEIENIAVDDSFVYIKVSHTNSSKINYNIDFNGFILTTSSKLTKVGNNDDYLYPIFVYNKCDVIPSKKEHICSILVYSLFTLKDNQKVVYFLQEKNGGREIFVPVNPDILLKSAFNLKLN